MKRQENHIPDNLLLQWHVTQRCNLRCKHCYQDNYFDNDMSLSELNKIILQYKSLLKEWRKKKKVFAHINVTGGEPFIRMDFMNFLKILSKNKRHFSFAILTNGTLIDKKIAKKLKKLNPKFVQISIEGKKETHDKIRGPGNYDKAINALKYLKKQGIPTYISFTAHKNNHKEFSEVVDIGRKIGVTKIWSDRLIPDGSGRCLISLSPEETCRFIEQMYEIRKNKPFFSKTEVAMHRALQFHSGGGKPYKCSAGDSLLTIQPNGDLLPCRRMPIKIGNLKKERLMDIYYKNKLIKKLRDKEIISKGCENCFYSKLCNGGLRCLSYSVHKDPFRKDPGCWIN